MAGCDYRSCDVCGGKTFYDANLSYEEGAKGQDGKWIYPENSFRIAGEKQSSGLALGYVGDWAVICNECSKTHKTAIIKIETHEKHVLNVKG